MANVVPLAWRAFHLPKAGHTLEEYEDAFAAAPEQGRFAIADGASESAFAAPWAQILVEAFVHTPGSWSAWLTPARQRWSAQVWKEEMPWYTEIKYQEGAFAALLGLKFGNGRWRAAAVGDCCLFQVRASGLLQSFPLHRACDFGNRPSLLCSRPRHSQEPRTRRSHGRGNVRAGDTFFLLTDALAQWFLQEAEEFRQPWKDLQDIETQEQFVLFIEELRAAKKLRNDDVTLVMIQPQNS